MGGLAGQRAGRAVVGVSTGRAADGRAGPRAWRAEAADRDLDAVVVLFDAAARFVDRLPGARHRGLPRPRRSARTCRPTRSPRAPTGARRSGCSPRTPPRAWSGTSSWWPACRRAIWPDLRLRGSLLGSERLVDVLAGRAAAGAAASLVGQTSALLDEERRLFYVAVTRARRGCWSPPWPRRRRRRRRRGAAQPLPARAGPRPGRQDRRARPTGRPARPAGHRPARRSRRRRPARRPSRPGRTEPGPADAATAGVARDGRAVGAGDGRTDGRDAGELGGRDAGTAASRASCRWAGRPGRSPCRRSWRSCVPLVADPDGARGPAARGGGRAGPAGRRRRARARTRTSGGGCAPSPTTGRWSTRVSRSGSPRPRWRARCGAACAGCWNGTAARPGRRRAGGRQPGARRRDAGRGRQRRPGRSCVEYVAARFDAIELAARWLAGPERERAEAMVDKLLRWLAGNPRRLLAIEHEFARPPRRPGRARSS